MALSNAIHQQTVNNWREKGVLLRFHEDLLEAWEQDENQGYPFFKDNDSRLDEVVQLHEYERFGNLNYAAQMKISNAYKRLNTILVQYDPNHSRFESLQMLPQRYFIGSDLEISAFFGDLSGALDAVAGQVVLIYGFPIKLRLVDWGWLETLLDSMSPPWKQAQNPHDRNKNKQNYNVMPSQDLANIVSTANNKIKEFRNYRNSYTHRPFIGTIFDKEGFYLPKDSSVLPSLVINPLTEIRNKGTLEDVDRIKSELFNSLPLHKYCEATYWGVREVIEQVYEQVVQTYHTRLSNSFLVKNPHELYQFGLKT